MARPKRSQIEIDLGDEFWRQPQEALDETFNFMYSQAIAILRTEVRERGGSLTDFMLAERIAFLYAYLRQRESGIGDGDFSDRTRREMNKDWRELATSMKKLWNGEDNANRAEIVLKKVNTAIQEAMKDMPVTQAAALSSALTDSFEKQGL